MFFFPNKLTLSSSLIAVSCVLAFSSAEAFELQAPDGVDASFDTTLSIGTIVRTQSRDLSLIGRANGGSADSINFDEGDLNWGKGAVAAAVKANHEFSVASDDKGLFLRFNYFYDFINANTNKLNKTAKRHVGKGINLRDLYVYQDLDELFGQSSRIKIGNQVINWGESTFILNGINAINPIDVSAFRVPGAEVKDALLPIPAVDLSFAVTDKLSFEGFYQFGFEETKLEARGSYFSTNNFASPGGDTVFLGFGDPQIKPTRAQGPVLAPSSPIVANPTLGIGPLSPFGSWVPRSKDKKPDGLGQFGLATRIFSEKINNTEFGFYYTDLHSRLPLISANTATLTQFAGSPGTYANNSNYFLEYPKHIHTFGTSFATDLGSTGISWAGEVSHKTNQPLQIHSVDLLQAALAPASINGAAVSTPAAVPALTGIFNTNPVIADLGGIDPTNPVFDSQKFFGREISGYRRKHVSQAQTTITKLFGPAFKANQWVAVGEVGVVHIHNMPSRSSFRFDGPGLYKSGNPAFVGIGGMPSAESLKNFPTKNSYGYRLLARFDYLDVKDGVSLFPSIRFNHDFKGTTPNPLGTFVEGRKALGLSLTATYLQSLSGEIAYNHFFGGGQQNLVNDRDFVSATIKYSF